MVSTVKQMLIGRRREADSEEWEGALTWKPMRTIVQFQKHPPITLVTGGNSGVPTGIRTPVLTVKG